MDKSQLFFARLKGANEVPPVRTDAFGVAKFKASRDEKKLAYQLIVNNLDNFTEAHIHLGKRGENGPVVAFLFDAEPDISVDKGVVDGILTAKDLIGPLKGKPLSTLLELMRDGKTYVNAHTVQNPDGEIRGQIKPFDDC